MHLNGKFSRNKLRQKLFGKKAVMEKTSNDNGKELECIAGAYGPVESVPLLGELIGHWLLDMVAVAYCKLGFPSGIFQNDGTIFPAKNRIKLLKNYCQEIRSTKKGLIRCHACDCQAVVYTGGDKASLEQDLEETIRNFPTNLISEFGFEREAIYCYECHAGLLELVRAVSLDLGDASPSSIGAIWAGQNKMAGYNLSHDEVRQLAENINYPEPRELIRLYEEIELISKEKLNERARSLAETARPIEDSALASFQNRKRMQYDRLTVTVLNTLRTSLSKVNAVSTKSIQKQVYLSMVAVLEELTDSIQNCYSVICEIPTSTNETKDQKIEVRAVAQAGLYKRKFDKINIRRSKLDEVFSELKNPDDLKSFPLCNLDSEFFTKMNNAIQINDVNHVILSHIPALQNRILWITLLCGNSDALTPSGNPLPDFITMLENILRGVTQIINVAYLVAQQQDSMWILKKRTKQLEEKDIESKLLIRNIAHQVSRPIMELKQTAYILYRGFSISAYDGFRACLNELERGCRNFDIYETLTTDIDKRGLDFQARSSFHIMDIMNQADERVRPYLRAERRELLIRENANKGHTIPKVTGNPESTVECMANVLHNAIKYSIGSRPVEVQISYTQGSTVNIRVTNYGIELPKDSWERIFQETIRGESAKTVAIEGSGFGLYISRNLIKIHGGQIKVESSEEAEPTTHGVRRWKTTFLVSLKC